jgi:hypothetical protein
MGKEPSEGDEMSAQPQHHEWTDEDRTAEDHALMVARLQAAVDAALPVPVRRPLRERLARACRLSPRVAPHFGRDGH